MKKTIGIILLSILGFLFVEGLNALVVFLCVRKGINPMIGVGVCFGVIMGAFALGCILWGVLYLIDYDDFNNFKK